MARKLKATKLRQTPKAVLKLPDLDQAKSAVLNSLSSTDAQRGYRHAMDEFIEWYCSEPRLSFNRAVVLRYRMHLESRNLAPGTVNLRLGVVRRLAYEAADCGLLSPDLAAGIRRVKGVKKLGVRLGNWLTVEQATTLWQTPSDDRLKGKRDRALLAVLLACGLRRHEAVSLEVRHVQQREDHWAIIDLHGKAGHVRTVPVPDWVKALLDRWTQAAAIHTGKIFRRVTKAGTVWGTGMTEKAAELSKRIDSVKHLLWHGNVAEALDRMGDMLLDLELIRAHAPAAEKLAAGLSELETYIRNNREFIPNFGERYRQGETITTAFVESTINQVVSRRFVKKQQMQWTLQGAHLLLQIRTKVLNNELENAFRNWYPQFRAQEKAAA